MNEEKNEIIESNEKRFNSNYFGTLEAVVKFDMDQMEILYTEEKGLIKLLILILIRHEKMKLTDELPSNKVFGYVIA